MLEGQRFEPAGRLAQFVRVASDLRRDDVEVIVDRLMDQLASLDAIEPSGWRRRHDLHAIMAGTGLHFSPSMATDDQGVIKPAPKEIVAATAAAVEPAELLHFARRLLNGARRRRRQPRWSAVNPQRVELAQLCLARALSEPIGSGLTLA